jgi:hypothetical protein
MCMENHKYPVPTVETTDNFRTTTTHVGFLKGFHQIFDDKSRFILYFDGYSVLRLCGHEVTFKITGVEIPNAIIREKRARFSLYKKEEIISVEISVKDAQQLESLIQLLIYPIVPVTINKVSSNTQESDSPFLPLMVGLGLGLLVS